MRSSISTVPKGKPLPTGGEREILRDKGQFWTPDWIAEAMVGYVIAGGFNEIFDPAVGAGAFFKAADKVAQETSRPLKKRGAEIDPLVLDEAQSNGLSNDDLASVQITDFVLRPPKGPIKAIVANPPYIRHHRLTSQIKSKLKIFGAGLIGRVLDGRAGFHVYFLLRALQLLDKNGRLAFIVPADICEGVFAETLWNWITVNYSLDAVVTFSPEASPFPNVDTNPIILMIRNAEPKRNFLWVRCSTAFSNTLKQWTLSDFKDYPHGDLTIHNRSLSEALATGLSRYPIVTEIEALTLGHFAKILRGIATGANDYFFLTVEQSAKLGIDKEFLLPAIGRVRDVSGDEITLQTIANLEAKGRPTLLFSPDDRPLHLFPRATREYLKEGEEKGINKRILIATRNPWYKMEIRVAPPILFAYLGRRNTRFIRNRAGVIPLTCFLCVYPLQNDEDFVENFFKILQHPSTIANLALVGKSYGGGAIKVEPRALERLPIPVHVVSQVGLDTCIRPEPPQLRMLFKA